MYGCVPLPEEVVVGDGWVMGRVWGMCVYGAG